MHHIWTLRSATRCLCTAGSSVAASVLLERASESPPIDVRCDAITNGSGSSSSQVSKVFTADAFTRRVSVRDVALSRRKLIRRNLVDFSEVYEPVGEVIGEGGFSVVHKAKHKGTGQYRAVKCVFKDRILSRNDFENELDLLVELDSPFVVKLVEYFEQDNEFLLVFELLTGGDLLDRIQEKIDGPGGCFTEAESSVILRHMLKAVLCCHSRHIVHRDIKPENFVYQSNSPTAPLKLIDMGLSCYMTEADKMKTSPGTPCYMAPEIARGQKSAEIADVWSIGAVLYVLLFGEPLIRTDATYQEIDDNVTPEYIELRLKGQRKWKELSKEAQDLLVKMLQHDPENRIDIYQALRHPFVLAGFKGYDIGKFDESCLTKMRHFGSLPALKRLALLVAAHLTADEEQCLSARRLYRILDKNGRGFIDFQEMQAAIEAEGCALPPDFADVFRRVDVQHSGVVNFVEFLAAMLDPAFYQQEAVYSAVFRLLDSASRDGKLDAEDLACFLSMQGKGIAKVLEEVVPRKGYVSRADFQSMMFNE